jgi:hypothetical protein
METPSAQDTPLVKLTKSGKPRKPYVMTPARKEAFEKCRLARLAKQAAPDTSSEALPERVQRAKDQAQRIDKAMGVPEEAPAAVAPTIAPPKPALVPTPTQARFVPRKPKTVNFPGKEKPIPVRTITPKRGELDDPAQPEPVSVHIEDTETETEEQNDEDMGITDEQKGETPDEQQAAGKGTK